MSFISSFLTNSCVIQVANTEDFNKFKTFCRKYDLYEDFFHHKGSEKISYWRNLAKINDERLYGRRWLRPNFPLYFEYQHGKGGTFGWDYKTTIDWYGHDNIIDINDLI